MVAAYSAGIATSKSRGSTLNTHFARVAPIVAYKSVDESVTSSTTLQDDDELVITGVASAVYTGRLHLVYSGDTTGDMKFRFTFPSSDFTWSQQRMPAAATSGSGTTIDWGAEVLAATTNTATITAGAAAAQWPVWADFTWFVGATGGDLRLQWAQSTSSVTALTIKKGSSLWVVRCA